MPSPFLQCRVDRSTRDRAELAAEQCDLPLGTWLRLVVDGALEAHFDVELVVSERDPDVVYEVRRLAGSCTCPGFEHQGHCKHLNPVAAEPIIPETYVSDIEAAAAEQRATVAPPPKVEHPRTVLGTKGPVDPPRQPLSPRECPHLPSMRTATGRCSCGTVLGGRLRR